MRLTARMPLTAARVRLGARRYERSYDLANLANDMALLLSTRALELWPWLGRSGGPVSIKDVWAQTSAFYRELDGTGSRASLGPLKHQVGCWFDGLRSGGCDNVPAHASDPMQGIPEVE